ncbi:MAG: hypothetical protein ACRCZF_16865, partial [Gemmataceae bacterium]
MNRITIGLLLGLFSLTPAPAVAQWMNGWGQFQGNAAHTAYVPGELDTTTFRRLWTVTPANLPLGSGQLMPASVIDTSGIYLTASRFDNPNRSGTVLSLNPDTGTTGWSLPLTAYLTTQISAPAVADGKVYVQKGGSSGNSGNPSQFPRAVGI